MSQSDENGASTAAETAAIEAFRSAVQSEVRFGIRDACKDHVDALWLTLLERLDDLYARRKGRK